MSRRTNHSIPGTEIFRSTSRNDHLFDKRFYSFYILLYTTQSSAKVILLNLVMSTNEIFLHKFLKVSCRVRRAEEESKL